MKIVFAAAAAFLLAGTVASSAADIGPSYVKAAPIASVYNWTGFYVGGNIGGGVASAQFNDPCFYCSSATPTGGFFTGGAQLGYNYQFGHGLIGIEADVNGNSNFKGSVIGGDDTFAMGVNTKSDLSGTIRARGGLVLDNALIYVTGGAAWADVKQTGIEVCNVPGCLVRGVNVPIGAPTGTTANRSGIVGGGVIGAGVDFALSRNWIIGVEFLHTMYADKGANILIADGTTACSAAVGSSCSIRSQLTTDVARIRFNYKFD
jgi:outer membrane immunogenic protein